MIPTPCVALCLLFPTQKITGTRRAEQRAEKAKGSQPPLPADLFFVEQRDGIGNACGTIACIHAAANAAAQGAFALVDGSPLANFIALGKPETISKRGELLGASADLQAMSDDTAAAGQTEGAGTDDAQGQHFIALVPFGGMLYELDGRTFDEEGAAFPFCHGRIPDTDGAFLQMAGELIRKDFMARDPDNYNFNIVALCRDA